MKDCLIFLKYSACIAICCLMAGCYNGMVTILDSLDQDSANSVIIELGQYNIDAEKLKDKTGTFAILVPDNQQIKALAMLKNNGKPQTKYATLGEIFKKDSFISSPLEEQARFIYALEEQISNMVAEIDGVVYVSTQVSLPPPSDNLLQGQDIRPSAAVLIKAKEGYHLEMYTNRIKQLVANSVPGLTSDRVEVLFVDQKNLN